jgi:integrase
MATILKTQYGTYQAQVRRKGHKPIFKTFNEHKDAAKWARAIESRIDSGLFQDLREAQQTTLADLLGRYEDEILPTKKSQAQVKSVIKLLKRELGSLSLMAVTPSLLSSYRNKRMKSVGPQTARHDLSLLSRAFNVAIKDWGIHLPHGNPVRMVRMPSIPRGRDRRPTAEELAKLQADRTVGVIVTLAVETGMRRGELASIRWEHIHWGRRTLLIAETKTDTPREIPLTDGALEALRAVLRASKVVEVSAHGLMGPVLPRRADSLSQAFDRACQRYGIEGLHFHDLRHEATSRFFELGLNPMEVAAITGHQDLKMLRRYTHLRPEALHRRLAARQSTDFSDLRFPCPNPSR